MIGKRMVLLTAWAAVSLACLTGCSHKTDATDAQGKPHFTAGPGVPADVIARMNAAKARGAGTAQPK